MIVTIDGPAGTGKSTVAKLVAERLGLPYFDTGAMYRSFAYLLLEHKIALTELERIGDLLRDFCFEIRTEEGQKRYFANGCDVTEVIRTQPVTKMASQVAALPAVRQELWKIQRAFAEEKGGVFEGRDLGTVVFPEASLKIFLTARPEVRAQRRFEELLRKNPEEAKTLDREKMQQELQKRDEFDSSREIAPLKCPEGAYVVDTSDLTIEEVVERIIQYKKKKKGMGCFYRVVFFFCCSWAKLFYRHKVYGLEHFYPKGAILAANHASFLDPPLIAISWPEEVHFLARETLFRNWFFGKLIRALNAHPVSGGSGDIGVFRMVCGLLEEGKKVILFPEGTRAAQDKLGEIKPGVGVLVARSKTAVIPTYLKGPYEVWSRHRKFPKLFGKTLCVFGSPILWDSYAHLDKKEAQDAIVHKVESSLRALRQWVEDGARGVPP